MYEWKRFWCPRDASFQLGDEGFLSDPDSEYGDRLNPNVMPFERIEDAPCLVLLGEPGIGKSTAIQQEVISTQARAAGGGDAFLDIDLGGHGDERRLINEVFKSRIFADWSAGTHVLHLFLDSLDECRLLIPNVARIVHSGLRKHRDKLGRLRFRIACRTADWPKILNERLAELWGEGSPSVYELVPLRRQDVARAASALGLDAERFVAEVIRVGAPPLAIKPVTLNFLMQTYQRDGGLPLRQVDLYEQGCLLLCEEPSEDRRGARQVGSLSAEQRMRIAERIAAATVFGGKNSVYIGINYGSCTTDDIQLREISGGAETVRRTSFDVGIEQLGEAIGTGLFSGRGDERVGFAHRTYAEFLAASYLMHCGVEPAERMKFIRHADDAEGRIVPQLRQTAAWLAGLAPDVFDEIIAVDPQVLLRSDVASVAAEDRQSLLQRLLDLCESNELITWDWGDLSNYYKLAHPSIVAQLAPYIRDKTKSEAVRRLAIDVADACEVTGLQSALADLALDAGEVSALRYRATHGVMDFGDGPARLRLKPLASSMIHDDPEFKLRSAVIRRMYPTEITADEVFATLQVPTDDTYGTYRLFLYEELPQLLSESDLPIALRWAAGLTEQESMEDSLERLVSKIAFLGWQSLHVPDIRAAMVDYVLARLRIHQDILSEREQVDGAENARRSLVELVVPRIDDFETQGYGLVHISPGLVRSSDVLWLIDKLRQTDEPSVAEYWARLIHRAFDTSNLKQLESVLLACESQEALREEFENLLTPIRIDSDVAANLRQQHAQHLEWERRRKLRQNPPPLDPQPSERIRNWLDECESGNAEAWFYATRDLQLEMNSRRYDHELEVDLTALPGWHSADAETRARIVDGAKLYLLNCDNGGQDWLGTSSTPLGAFWGYKALLLLRKEATQIFDALPANVWAKWSASVVSFYDHGVPQKNRAIHDEIAVTCGTKALREVCEGLRVVFQKWHREDGMFILPQFAERFWNDAIEASLLMGATDRSLEPAVAGCLLDLLLEKQNDDAKEFAVSLLVDPIVPDGEERERAVLAADSLICHAADAAWGAIWRAMQLDVEFGRTVIERVAYKDMRNPSLGQRISEMDVAELYVWLETQYPHSTDPKHKGAHYVSDRDAVVSYRDGLLRALRERGTSATIQALNHVQQKCPHLDWMPLVIIEAKQTLLRKTWRPVWASELLEMTQRPDSRLVRSAGQLQDVILESLGALQTMLQGETPAAPDVWNEPTKGAFRPKDENHLSDYVKRHLERDLRDRGIVSLREVQIRRGEGEGTGERTDIHVIGVVPGVVAGMFDSVRVIVEVKGEWHGELDTAMETQLVGRYLKDNSCQNGIYLVAWYECNQWDADDRRRQRCRQKSLDELRRYLAEQATRMSVNGRRIDAVALDTALR